MEIKYQRTKRHAAFIIDLLALSLVFWFVGLILNIKSESDGMSLVFFIIVFLYFVFANSKFSCTLGQYLFNLRVTDEKTNQNISLIKSFLRQLIFLTVMTGVGAICYIFAGYYWDKITKIKVIEVQEKISTKQFLQLLKEPFGG